MKREAMKRIPCLFLILVFSGTVSARKAGDQPETGKERNVCLDLAAGYSGAFGRYAGTDFEQKAAGHARGGFFVQLSGTWLGKKDIGLSASYCYQQNALVYSPDTVIGHQYTLGRRPWKNHYLVAGPAYIHSFGKFLVMVKVQAGAVLSFSSNFQVTMPAPDSMSVPYQSSGPGFGVALQALAGAGYRVTENLSVNLVLAYLGANPTRKKDYYSFTNVQDPVTGTWSPVYSGGEFIMKKKISTFNIGLGVAWKL